MDSLYNIILVIHIAFGTLSLITFWIPVFTKKGGNLHIKIGKVYVYTMWVVVISSVMLSLINVVNGRVIAAAFLGFLALLTAHPLWYAIVILNHKNEVPDHILKIRKVMALLLFLSALGLVIWSLVLKIQGQSILLLIFGILGLTQGKLAFVSMDKLRDSSNWLAEHLDGMIGTGIAAYTAFLAFGGAQFLSNILTGQLQIIPWILPTIVGTFVASRMKKKMKLSS